MNGRRRFVLGTVLSIQNNSFIYPACENCCSRLSPTSCRYECHKCGSSYKEAAHRYIVCVKVSEERRLHVITIFGKCLEQIFGASADSLHSHLQVSCQLSGDLEHGKAQELLFQAAERCLIGRSFIFAVKIPDNFDRSDSLSHSSFHRDMVACQIILLTQDPMSCTILSYFDRLVASVLSDIHVDAETDVSTDATSRDRTDLDFSKSSSSLPQSWNHYADYWQQSLGLVSSPLSNKLAESQCCNYRQGECSRAEQVPCPEALMSQNTTGPDMATQSSRIVSISTPRVKCSSSKHTHTIIPSPHGSEHFHSFPSKSKMALGQESYLQNVCKSGSRRSQSCSARTKQLPPQTAEMREAKEEIWEEFPFSESLSEFIARIEDNDGVKPHFTAKESKTITSIERKPLNERECSLMNIPDAWPTQNDTFVKEEASHCNFDNESNACVFNHPCKVATRNDTSLVDQTFPSADLTSFQNRTLLSGASAREQDRQSPRCWKVLLNGTYVDDGVDFCSFVEDPDKSSVSSEKDILSRRGNANVDDPKSSEVDMAKVTSEETSTITGDHYNASADLFEASNNPNDDETPQLQCTGSPNKGQRSLAFSITNSSCTELLPYQRRDSQISVSSLSETYTTWTNLPTEDFIPYLQSTPVLRRLSGIGRLPVDAWPFNMASSLKSSTVSIRTKSNSTVRHLLLKRQRRPTLFYGVCENYSLWSPNLSPCPSSEESTALIPKNRRTMLACKPRRRGSVLESKENYNNQTQGRDDELTCTVRRADYGSTGGEESIKHGGDTPDNMENLSPVNRSLQESEDRLSPVQEQLLPSDWSPELFSGKSDTSQLSLQRRLF